MDRDRNAVRVELGESKPKELPQQPAENDDAKELEIAELEQRITPTSIDSSIGTFF